MEFNCGSPPESTNLDFFPSLPNTKVILKRYLLSDKSVPQFQTSPWDAALGLSACLKLPFGCLCDISNTTRAKSHSDLIPTLPPPPAFPKPVPDSLIHVIVHAHSFSPIIFSDTPNPRLIGNVTSFIKIHRELISPVPPSLWPRSLLWSWLSLSHLDHHLGLLTGLHSPSTPPISHTKHFQHSGHSDTFTT